MSELEKMFARRASNIDESATASTVSGSKVFNPATDFPEFSKKQLKVYKDLFVKFDLNKSGTISNEELKKMMEKLGSPQTHITLKNMIRDVDEDGDEEISFREFLLIFRKFASGDFKDSPFAALVELASQSEVDVSEVGVGGAKNFFEAKAEMLRKGSALEAEVKKEQLERKQAREEKERRASTFKERIGMFNK